jgi:hypothetical protein
VQGTLERPVEKLKLSMGDKLEWEWLMFAKKLLGFEILSLRDLQVLS